MDILIWAGIGVCLVHSGLFSGLNLALMGLGRLRLEAETRGGNGAAAAVLALRRDSNLLLTTLLWGNVGVNVLLTLLTDSVSTGLGAFLFSTFGITLFGEIVPQAYFSRNALRVGARLIPLVRFYQLVLYPIAKPSALLHALHLRFFLSFCGLLRFCLSCFSIFLSLRGSSRSTTE